MTTNIGKTNCDIFTSIDVVKYMLDLSGYKPDIDLSKVRVIEPSCGDGEFVVEIVERLIKSSKLYNFDVNIAIDSLLICYDTDIEKIEATIRRVESLPYNISLKRDNFRCEDFLLAGDCVADLIIGNPPYIRHEQIDAEKKVLYKKLYSTFRYRADIYIPFFEKSLKSLAPNGTHCFICSNRWLKNQYGKLLRGEISASYNLKQIINLESVNPFQKRVVAYPAITLIENRESQKHFKYAKIDDINHLQEVDVKSEKRVIVKNDEWSDAFNPIKQNSNLLTIEEMGFKVGIGVATGADSVFIGEELVDYIEKELLLPIILSKDINCTSVNWSGKYLFNPFDNRGNIIDLEKYPKANLYLLSHKSRLQSRHIAKRNPNYWYRTIDKIDPLLLSMPKILLPDISNNRYVTIDNGEYYPHHNMYYITGSDNCNLTLLSAILMSDFVSSQLRNLSNVMNGGYPRWQSQYIKKLRVPNIFSLDEENRGALLDNYRTNNLSKINSIVNLATSSI